MFWTYQDLRPRAGQHLQIPWTGFYLCSCLMELFCTWCNVQLNRTGVEDMLV